MSAELQTTDQRENVFRSLPLRYLGYGGIAVAVLEKPMPRMVAPLTLAWSIYVVGDVMATSLMVDREGIANGIPKARRDVLFHNSLTDTTIWQVSQEIAFQYAKRHLQHSPVWKKWLPIAAAVGILPILSKPMDHAVDYIMDNTTRKWAAEELKKLDE